MKRDKRNTIHVFVSVALIVTMISSCKEVGPTVDLGKNKPQGLLIDTAYAETVQSPEAKNILIEEFTGVRCLNCPQAHTQLRSLIQSNGGRVIGMSLHSYLQDEVYPYSKLDLKSALAQKIEDYLLYPGYKPNGAIDRTNLQGMQSLCNDYLDWNTLVPQRLSVPTPVNISLSKSFNSANGDLTLDVKAHYTSDEAELNKLSVFLTEDSIITAQLQPNNTVDSNYVHNEIGRFAVSDTLGDKLNHELKKGTTVQRVYKVNLSGKGFVYAHLKVIAFVHRYATSKEILQVKEMKIN